MGKSRKQSVFGSIDLELAEYSKGVYVYITHFEMYVYGKDNRVNWQFIGLKVGKCVFR